VILGLNPKPGGASGDEDEPVTYVIPDFEVSVQADGEFLIQLNSRNLPPLRISPQYKKMWDEHKGDQETRQFIRTRIESAKWFIDSIQQRQNTLLTVMTTIVALQERFFRQGENLRPMILKDVADRVGMDISTISRVVNGKYVQTAFGVFELKYFFNEGLETESGEDVSNRELKNLVAELIGKEDKSKPLSDDAIAAMLAERGFKVARRTVTKYREQLGIAVARLRKEM
jgi:RNA polymerase sigma-54 factor